MRKSFVAWTQGSFVSFVLAFVAPFTHALRPISNTRTIKRHVVDRRQHQTKAQPLPIPIRSKQLDVSAVTDEDSTRIDQIALDSGVSMEVLSRLPDETGTGGGDFGTTRKPCIIFLHGSFHGAWCWRENFFPYFSARGYAVVACSWRGTGGTFAGEGVKKVKIGEHVDDLASLLRQLGSIIHPVRSGDPTKPVVVCHSFGGLAVMKYLEAYPSKAKELSGIVTMCSVPPSGNGKMTMRFLRRSLINSWKITAGIAMKRCLDNASLCRELFFGGDKKVGIDGSVEDYGISDSDVARYQSYFARDSEATIDLIDLSKQLPSASVLENGEAPFVDQLPPCMVIGATDDFLVDQAGLEETANYFGLDKPVLVDSPHDVMLGKKWENAAQALETWIEDTIEA